MASDLDMMAEEVPAEVAEVAPEQFIQAITESDNIAAELEEQKLAQIATEVIEDYKADKDSMSDWFQRMERGIDLAKLVKGNKTYPHKQASNIKYPLITSAALQFNARAYPAIVPSGEIVRTVVHGKDADGAKAARGERIAAHMSWQLSTQIEEWEEDTDKLLVQLPIVGTMVRKWWLDPVAGRARCRLIDAGAFIVNDKVKTLSDAPRCSEELSLYPAEIESRIRSGQFVRFEFDEGEDKQGPEKFVEQHTRLDLDEDGYTEPYIITVHEDTETVVRIVADFGPDDVKYKTEQQQIMVPVQSVDQMGYPVIVEQPQMQEVNTGILSINRGSYFVAHHFLPSLDGGFHGTGLGLLLGDISDSINTIINMLLDAGHYASLGGGFIGSEFRMKGGAQRFEPGEWKMVGATGQDVRSSVVPMTFPGPDGTLFQMLGMLIEAGREIASVKDIMTGDQERQQTATATIALIEQGMMVFTAAYKRIFRALKKEYKLLARINAQTVTPEEYNAFHDEIDQQGQPMMLDPREEYGAIDMDVQPVADPRSVTKMQEAAKAQLLMQLSGSGMVDPAAAAARVLEAMDIGDTEELVPQPDEQAMQMQAMQAQMQMQSAQAELSKQMAEIELTLAKVEEARTKAIKNLSDAQTDQDKVAIEASKVRMDGLVKMLEDNRERLAQAIAGGRGGLAGQPGNGGGQGGGPAYGGGAAQGGAGSLLGREAMAGIGPAGPAPAGAMGGGLL